MCAAILLYQKSAAQKRLRGGSRGAGISWKGLLHSGDTNFGPGKGHFF